MSGSWQELIAAMIETRLVEVHTSMPGRVVSYNAARETVDVRPQFREVIQGDDTEEENDLPVIPDVPVAWPSGGDCYVTFPLSPGDPVALVFMERDPGAWRTNGDVVNPGDQRMHHLSAAWAIPGGVRAEKDLLGSTKRHSSKVVIGAEVLLGTSSSSEAMIKGNAFKTVYDAHVHPTPFGPSGPPTVPIPPTALSTKHKLDG